jgi:hypothetical protein
MILRLKAHMAPKRLSRGASFVARMVPGIMAAMTTAFFGCGGKVVFDTNAGGAGGSASASKAVGATSSKSVASSSSTGGAQCPKEHPIQGAPCSPSGLVCQLPNDCCGSAASCIDGKWSIPIADCSQLCTVCGPTLECASSAVCVATQVVNTTLYDCKPNPCQGQPLTCGCASPVCEAIPASCVSASGAQITCDTGTKG